MSSVFVANQLISLGILSPLGTFYLSTSIPWPCLSIWSSLRSEAAGTCLSTTTPSSPQACDLLHHRLVSARKPQNLTKTPWEKQVFTNLCKAYFCCFQFTREWVFLHKSKDFVSSTQRHSTNDNISAEEDTVIDPAIIIPTTRHNALHNFSIWFICKSGTQAGAMN